MLCITLPIDEKNVAFGVLHRDIGHFLLPGMLKFLKHFVISSKEKPVTPWSDSTCTADDTQYIYPFLI